MVECSEDSKLSFNKLFLKLVAYKELNAGIADDAKFKYAKLLSTIVKEPTDWFVSFDKQTDRRDTFLWTLLVDRVDFKVWNKLFPEW